MGTDSASDGVLWTLNALGYQRLLVALVHFKSGCRRSYIIGHRSAGYRRTSTIWAKSSADACTQADSFDLGKPHPRRPAVEGAGGLRRARVSWTAGRWES